PTRRRSCGRSGWRRAPRAPGRRSASTPPRRSGRACDAGGPSACSFQAADAEVLAAALGGGGGALLLLGLDGGDRRIGEEVGAQGPVPWGHVAPHPLEVHDRVLDLLVAVVGQHGAKALVLARRPALVVPVDGLDLLLQARERADRVADRLGQVALVVLGHGAKISQIG